MANQTERERTAALHRRSFELTCSIVTAYPKRRYLDDASRIIWRQLLKAISSSTFNLEEAYAASSDADFLAKMRIALRETREARVAIRVIVRCELAGNDVGGFEDETRQMAAIFAAIIVNKKANMARQKGF